MNDQKIEYGQAVKFCESLIMIKYWPISSKI